MTDWQLFSFGARALVPSRVRLPITVTHSRPARTRPDFTAGFAIVAAETGGRTGMEDAVEVNDGALSSEFSIGAVPADRGVFTATSSAAENHLPGLVLQ